MKKRFIIWIIIFVLMIGILPMGGFAAETDFIIEEGILIKYTGSDKVVVIPSGVTTIGEKAFAYNDIVESITIPKSVTTYLDFSFVACTNLSQVIFEQGIRHITGDFYLCENLVDVVIPSSVQSVGVTRTDMVMAEPFVETPWLENQIGFVIVGDGILLNYIGEQEEVVIPNNVKKIGSLAFRGNDVKSVIMHEGVKEIQPYAFAWSRIEKIIIANGLESIEYMSFWMTPLKDVVLPQSVKTINENAFSGGITNVTINNPNTSIAPGSISNDGSSDYKDEPGMITIYGYANSTAQKYVTEMNSDIVGDPSLQFRALETQKPVVIQVPINTQETLNASLNKSKVLVNGVEQNFESYTINNNNYFKLRDLANVVNGTEKQFEVTWDGTNNVINLLSNTVYTNVGGEMTTRNVPTEQLAKLSTSAIHIDGLEIKLAAYLIGDNNYFKLRDVAKAFEIGITWNQNSSTIGIDTSMGYTD